MKIDLIYLQKHYESLSDEALLEVNRDDLVEGAKQIYDAELASRNLEELPELEEVAATHDNDPEFKSELTDSDEDPDWLEDGAEVWSCIVYPGRGPAPEAAEAQAALTEAGIPSHLELQEILPEEEVSRQVKHQWRLMVPGNVHLQAISEIDREIFNEDFETEWKSHLEAFSDAELRTMHPQVAFGGLFDKVARVTRAYNEELTRRGMK